MHYAAIAEELRGAPGEREALYDWFFSNNGPGCRPAAYSVLSAEFHRNLLGLIGVHTILPDAVSELADLCERMVEMQACPIMQWEGAHELPPVPLMAGFSYKRGNKCAACCAELHDGEWI